MRHFLSLSLCAFVLAACGQAPNGASDGVATDSDPLIGGHVASDSEYPAVVYLGGCTGVKVGPRQFLSAAHCFSTQTSMVMSSDNNAQNQVTLSITSIVQHPQYQNCAACAGDGSMNDFGLRPDVALITVLEQTPSVPVAVIDPNPVAVGSPVTLSGYGCENGVNQPSGPARLKVGDTHTVDPLTLSDAPSIPLGYNTTFGPGNDPSAPGLCPGDSGGPLFRTGTNLVVGINSLLTYGGDMGTVFGNWFTRLDQGSRYDVYHWLTNLMSSEPTPCAGICAGAIAFSDQFFASGNLGTGASCYETAAPLTSGNCGAFVSPRSLSINGRAMVCNGSNLTLPPKRNGGYCFNVTAGNQPWAWFHTW